MLAGFEENEDLKTLIKDLKYHNHSDKFSKVMPNTDFLKACWVKIRSLKRSLTPAFADTLDGINNS
jgi:hypothetical protein